MNKYQEALHYLNKSLHTLMDLQEIYDVVAVEYLETLQELVDKETPIKTKKPFVDDCPNCGEFMLDTEEHKKYNISFYNYCPKCGQKLDWSDENVNK